MTMVVETCWNILAGVDSSYSPGASSALHSQVNGVLAALTLVVLVFVVEQHRDDHLANSTLALLPILFLSSVGAAFEFAVVSADRICERSAVLYILASSLYLLSALMITAVFRSLIRLNVQTDRKRRVPAHWAADAAFIIAAIAATLHYLVAWQDIAVEFGRSPGPVLPLVALPAVAAMAVGGSAHFLRRKRAKCADALSYVYVFGAMLLVFTNLAAFALVSTVTDWSDTLDTFDDWWWLRYVVMATVGVGLGLLWAVSHCDLTERPRNSSAPGPPAEVVDRWDLGPLHRQRTTRYQLSEDPMRTREQ